MNELVRTGVNDRKTGALRYAFCQQTFQGKVFLQKILVEHCRGNNMAARDGCERTCDQYVTSAE